MVFTALFCFSSECGTATEEQTLFLLAAILLVSSITYSYIIFNSYSPTCILCMHMIARNGHLKSGVYLASLFSADLLHIFACYIAIYNLNQVV